MEKLQDLSQSELQELLDNAERVEAMALESDEIQNIQLEREMALAANRSLAEQNLDRKPYLESQKEELVSRYLQLEAVQQKYREHCAQKDGMAGQVSPEALFNRLQVESSKTEEESESLADEFLEGSLALDSFLDRFLSLRSLAHKRRVRIEKLQEVLRQRNSASSTATDKPDPAPSSSTHSTTSNNLPLPKQPVPAPALSPSGLPYSPYPVSPPNPTSVPAVAAASGPSNPPAQFPPYPSAGSSFTPAAGYTGGPPRPAFGPLPPPQPSQSGGGCPYPTQPSAFTGPHPGSAFGQYTPSNAPAPYPASYSYGGYSYPAGPAYNNTQSPTGRPMYRPGYGVPQPYS
ncbi:vacuolar protein sorting-associated protein 37C [Periophthalmus magnuspinnatus]|uniref:vacuolar protein sorting-associated protein 37C n=1 Tax=Periophthalmus magnuspinnatus TaxID=409849 RepID=UPI00145A1C5B|nr:vacuolar protein sorting-associated protein 37C [Periophthalmus magnuspinnatus]XP_055085616.1 vacuolar protein sorting-associated protein 37C [Periophthalmus magnuspinnatus]